MNELPGVLVMAALALLALIGMVIGWRRRAGRDAGLVVPFGAAEGETRSVFDGLYVATTHRDRPLDRIAVRPLGFRARATVTVTGRGVALELAGSQPVFLPVSLIDGVGRATWTIDRVVERDGLVMIAWHDGAGTSCDTYLRLQGSDPGDLVAAIESLLTPSTPTGATR
jgi:hypothetical protein